MHSEDKTIVACVVTLIVAMVAFSIVAIIEHSVTVRHALEYGYEQTTVPGHTGKVWQKPK